MSQRMVRVNRLLQTTLGQLLPGLVRDYRVQAAELVVVHEVQTTPDLSLAKVMVAIEGQSEQICCDALDGLQAARGFLRREVGRRLRLRRMPELRFIRQEQGELVSRVGEILSELERERALPRTVSLEEVVELIQGGHRVLVTTHPAPDGDAVGSVVALTRALELCGKEVIAYNPDPIPERFRFLAGVDAFVSELPSDGFDLTVVLDCSDARMFPDGIPSRQWLGQVVIIDHHTTVGQLGEFIYRDPAAAASGILVFRLLEPLGVALDRAVAEALYCSILSDTGSFRYGNTNSESMRIAAMLLDRGVDPWHVASNLYESQPPNQLELLAAVLGTLQISNDGRTAALLVSEEMLQRTNCTSDMVDGFINYARALRGVEVGVLLRPQASGLRVSLRSRGTVDVSEIAGGFGGGGHRNAAGFTVEESASELLPRLFAEVSERCAAA
jgi:phosphoesterase RecJ-like protein